MGGNGIPQYAGRRFGSQHGPGSDPTPVCPADAIRRDGQPRWLILTGLIHDLGKILCLFGEPQWAVVGDVDSAGRRSAGQSVDFAGVDRRGQATSFGNGRRGNGRTWDFSDRMGSGLLKVQGDVLRTNQSKSRGRHYRGSVHHLFCIN